MMTQNRHRIRQTCHDVARLTRFKRAESPRTAKSRQPIVPGPDSPQEAHQEQHVSRVKSGSQHPGNLAGSDQHTDRFGHWLVGLVDDLLGGSRVQRLAETVLDPDIVGKPLEPHPEGLERLMPGEHIGHRVDEHLDVMPVDSEDQRLAGREVAVERSWPDACPLRDRVQRRCV